MTGLRFCFYFCVAASTATQAVRADTSWPEKAWPTATAEEIGPRESLYLRAKAYAMSAGGSGMIVHHGKVILRWGDQDQRYDIKSATKSIGATALGLALMDGKLSLNDLATQRHPTFGTPPSSNADTGWLGAVTLRHLATQTAGFAKPGGYEPVLFEPGTKWHYSDGGPNWLAECVTLAYRQDIEELMFQRVFGPLGIERDDLRWRKNQYREATIDGIARREFGAGVHANVDALARIGYLYLREGRWRQRQILSPQFVKRATGTIDSVVGLPEHGTGHGNASDHYGLLWWSCVAAREGNRGPVRPVTITTTCCGLFLSRSLKPPGSICRPHPIRRVP